MALNEAELRLRVHVLPVELGGRAGVVRYGDHVPPARVGLRLGRQGVRTDEAAASTRDTSQAVLHCRVRDLWCIDSIESDNESSRTPGSLLVAR